MRSAQRVGLVVAVVAVLSFTACSESPNPTSPSTTAPPVTPGPTEVSATASPAPTTSGDDLAEVDAICRDSTYRDPGALTVSVTVGEMVTIVYTDPEGDFLCQYLPRYGSSAVVQGGFEHFADQVTSEAPLVIDQNQSWTSETGTYVWGAVGPEVASVVVELDGATDPLEATIADGYFLAVIGPDLPCCIFTAIALDAGGQELARAP